MIGLTLQFGQKTQSYCWKTLFCKNRPNGWAILYYTRCLWKEFGIREIFLWNFMSCSGSKFTYSSTYLTFWLLDRIIVIILFVPFRTCNFLFEIVKLHDSTYLSNLNTTLQKNIYLKIKKFSNIICTEWRLPVIRPKVLMYLFRIILHAIIHK